MEEFKLLSLFLINMNKLILSFIIGILFIGFISASYSDCSIYGTCKPVSAITSSGNITNYNNYTNYYINATYNITNNITNNINTINNITNNITNTIYQTQGVNTTQMTNLTVISIIESWLQDRISYYGNLLFNYTNTVNQLSLNVSSINTTSNIQNLLNSTGIYSQGNSSFNQSFTNGLYAPNTTAGIQYLINSTGIYSSSGGNSSWNQSFANTLYAPNSTAGIQSLLLGTNISQYAFNQTMGLLTMQNLYNATASMIANLSISQTTGINATWNESYARGLFFSTNSTYNATYANYATNVSLNWTNLAVNELSPNFTAINNSVIQLYTINSTANIQTLLAGTNISQYALNQTTLVGVESLINNTNIQFNSLNANALNVSGEMYVNSTIVTIGNYSSVAFPEETNLHILSKSLTTLPTIDLQGGTLDNSYAGGQILFSNVDDQENIIEVSGESFGKQHMNFSLVNWANALYIRGSYVAGENRIGVGTFLPNATLDVKDGTIHAGNGLGSMTFNSIGNSSIATLMSNNTMNDSGDLFIEHDLQVRGVEVLTGGYATIKVGDIAENLQTINSRNSLLCHANQSCLGTTYNHTELNAGDVVCINPLYGQVIEKCNSSNSQVAVGVVTNTSVLQMGQDIMYAYPVSVSGIVFTKVSNENGDIHPGDSLVSASIPGYAMKSDYPPKGMVIGMAYDFCPYGQTTCVIPIFVSLSYSDPSGANSMAVIQNLQNTLVSMQSQIKALNKTSIV